MENPKTGSASAGSPQNVPAPSPDQGTPAGQTKETGGDTGKEISSQVNPNDLNAVVAPVAPVAPKAPAAPKASGTAEETKAKDYDELATRFGSQGQELGEYRQFFQNIAPLLDKLDQSPELVQAIIDGKIDKDIAQAVIEGRVNVQDAADVQQAAETVKEEMGEKKFELATPEAITKLVEKEVSKVRKEFEERADLQTFQDYTQKFIEKTADFQEYSDEIDKWLDTHDVSDIEVAYYAVKGKMSESKAKEAAELAIAERAKEVLANAPGGAQAAQFSADGTPIVDRLISGRANPNSFFQ